MTTPDLTEEEAQAMLSRLSRHYREPVQPISKYCEGLRTWSRALSERADRLRVELFPDTGLDWRDDTLKERRDKAWESYNTEMKSEKTPKRFANREAEQRYYRLDDLRRAVKMDEEVNHIFLQIGKSNLLARLLYSGEKLRTRICPEHKGKWSGIEWQDNQCPHGCQLTGWLPEPEDGGKPLPGVQAVRLIPAEEGQHTMVRDVDGTELGTVRMIDPTKDGA